MSERAFSLEKKERIAARSASLLSCTKELKDKRAFECCDGNCKIGLTCSNWENRNGKKYYFRPSRNNELHILGCTEISSEEAKSQIQQEKNGAKITLKKNGLIKMTKSVNKARTDIGTHLYNDDTRGDNSNKKENGGSTGHKRESRNLYSLESFVELYTDTSINRADKIVVIDKEILSFNELFVDLQDTVEFEKYRIYHGKAFLKNGFKEGMLQIDFMQCNDLRVYSNLDAVLKRNYGKIVKKYLNKNVSVYVYLRGKIIKDGLNKKFVPYNKYIYIDLLCTE